MYEAELEFVKNYLISNEGNASLNKNQPFRKRYEHTLRVLAWANRIIEGTNADPQVLSLAVIFHDVGYGSIYFQSKHELRSINIFKNYAKDKYSEEVINKVVEAISYHTKRSNLNLLNMKIESILLLEADMLDEEGLMGLEFDTLTCGVKNVNSYNDALNAHVKYVKKFLQTNPMITKKASEYWVIKQKETKDYIKSLAIDLNQEIDI